jgi:hypothetical protein
MSVSLLPCPECGSAAELKEAYFVGVPDSYSYVHCTDPQCPLYLHSPHFWNDTHEHNDQHAVASWNERYAETWQDLIEAAASARHVLRVEQGLPEDRLSMQSPDQQADAA